MKPLARTVAACPACHAPLQWPDAPARAECSACGRVYAVAQGAAWLHLDAAGAPVTPALPQPAPQTGALRRAWSKAPQPNFAFKTAASRGRIPAFVQQQGPDAVILNLGSGRTDFGPRVVNLDIAPYAHVDIVAVGERLPVADTCLDAVITQGVLEHVPDLRATLAEIDRVLRPGGLVYHEAPFVQGFHASPNDFRRFTAVGMRELAPGYAVQAQGVAVGPSSALMWIASEWLALCFSLGNPTLLKAGRRLFPWLLSPLKWLDAWLERHPRAELIASAFYLVARKPDGSSEH
ncbi:MAG: class I SAM-dependent methyltransferase [Caldilineales bacterium]